MSIKQIAGTITVLVVSMLSAAAIAGDDDGLATVLRQVVERNLAAFNQEDAAGALSFIHTKSPEYGATKGALPAQFEALDARTELVRFQYIGHDDEFAVARVKLKTVDQSGEPFATNVMDTITIFHQEDGIWKYWSDHILGVELVQ